MARRPVKWHAQFTDADFCDRHFERLELPREIVEEVLCRTPGVIGALQPVHWWVHCQDAAEFVGVEAIVYGFGAGHAENIGATRISTNSSPKKALARHEGHHLLTRPAEPSPIFESTPFAVGSASR